MSTFNSKLRSTNKNDNVGGTDSNINKPQDLVAASVHQMHLEGWYPTPEDVSPRFRDLARMKNIGTCMIMTKDSLIDIMNAQNEYNADTNIKEHWRSELGDSEVTYDEWHPLNKIIQLDGTIVDITEAQKVKYRFQIPSDTNQQPKYQICSKPGFRLTGNADESSSDGPWQECFATATGMIDKISITMSGQQGKPGDDNHVPRVKVGCSCGLLALFCTPRI